MNMNKILVSGLLVALSFPLTEAEACGNGGFYVGINAGVGFTQAKYRNSVAEQEDVIDKGKEATVGALTHNGNGGAPAAGNYYLDNDIKNTVTGTSLKKNKTKFLAELSVGWDHRYNDVMFGIDVNFGMKFGKSKKTAKGLALRGDYTKIEGEAVTVASTSTSYTPDGGTATTVNAANSWDLGTLTKEDTYDADEPNAYDSTAEYTAKVKNQWTISFMPRVGYLVTPQCELFVTAGMMITKNKFTLNNDGGNLVTKKKAKVVPVLGGGVRYEFNEHLFTKLEYNYEFKAKMSKTLDGVTHKIKNSSHTIKLGIGYRF